MVMSKGKPGPSEVQVEVDGKQYVLKLGLNELIHLQTILDYKGPDNEFFQWFSQQLDGGLRVTRLVMAEALKKHHPEIAEDAEAVGDWISALGTPALSKALVDAMRWALPTAPAEKPAEASAPASAKS